MPVYGRRPSDVVSDSRGNALRGVTVHLFATESDANALTAELGTATTDDSGRWSFAYEGGELWARVGTGLSWRIDNTGEGAGVSSHSALTNLDADDHPQYHNDTRGDARYYTKVEVDAAIAGGAAPSWTTLTDKPTEFAPSAHTHPANAVTFTPTGEITATDTQTAVVQAAALAYAASSGTVLVCRYASGDYPILPSSKPAGVQVVSFYGPTPPASLPSWVGTGGTQAVGEYTYAALT